MRTVQGDLCDITREDDLAILQQCNCITRNAHGLSQTLQDCFPYCRVYVNRPGGGNRTSQPATPGTIEIFKGNGPDIVCLFAQYGPGKSKRWGGNILDTSGFRLCWFNEALTALGSTYKRVAVPYKIGCGLAGGHWPLYEQALREFERETGTEVVIYHRDGD